MRVTYSLAGQTIATRVTGDPVAANNGLFYIYGDHLGSTSVLSDMAGAKVDGSLTRYLPFGEYRGSAPTQTLTDRDFTGQKENRELGLLYYNARYYVPGIGRFASADTIVPDPTNPQSFNRFSYVRNNPLAYVDPSGHKEIAHDIGGGGNYTPTSRPMDIDEERAQKVGNGLIVVISVLPVAGDVIDVYDFAIALEDGDYSEAAIIAALGLLLPASSRVIREGGGVVVRQIIGGSDEIAGTIVKNTDGAVDLIRRNCSFSADTVVMTDDGLIPISEVPLGELVLAFNEETGEIGYYPVEAIWSHDDSVIVTLTIDGEQIETTPEHPFYTAVDDWLAAADLQIGDEIRTATWETGTVEAIHFTTAPQPMYNFTVAKAHTYFVGDGQWLVHNECWPSKIANGHAFDDHLDDFMAYGIETRDEFAEFLMDVQANGQKRDLGEGRFAYWLDDGYNDGWGTVMIVDPNNIDGGTAVRRANAQDYFDSLD